RGCDVAERSGEFIRSPNVDNRHRFAMVEPALELARLDPGERAAQPFDQSQQGARHLIDPPPASQADSRRPRHGTVAAASGRARARGDHGIARSQFSSPYAQPPAGRDKSPTAGPTKPG